MRIPLTQLAHDALRSRIQSGDIVIDATLGNGHDACFLAQRVGKQGVLIGFDLQQTAVEQTLQKLEASTPCPTIHLFSRS